MRDYTNEPATPTAKLKVLLSLSFSLSLSAEQKRKQKEFRSRDITRRGEHYFPFTVHLPSSDIARDFQRQRTTRSREQQQRRAACVQPPGRRSPFIHTPTTSSLEAHTSHG